MYVQRFTYTHSSLRTAELECSASKNQDVALIFKTFLRLSKINFGPKCGFKDDGGVGLRRNLSAYGRLKSPVKNNAIIGSIPNSPGRKVQENELIMFCRLGFTHLISI